MQIYLIRLFNAIEAARNANKNKINDAKIITIRAEKSLGLFTGTVETTLGVIMVAGAGGGGISDEESWIVSSVVITDLTGVAASFFSFGLLALEIDLCVVFTSGSGLNDTERGTFDFLVAELSSLSPVW